MQYVEKNLKRITEKITNYNSSKKKISLIFFSTFTDCIGFSLIKFWLNKRNLFEIVKKYFQGVYASVSMNEYYISYDKDKIDKYDTLILTWGNEKNFYDNVFKDKYFNVNSLENSKILWVVIMNNYEERVFNQKNVIFIYKKKIPILKKIFNFFYFSFKKIFYYKFRFDINFFSQDSFFSIYFFEKIFPFCNHDLNLIMMPYEGQPFQSKMINDLKAKFKSALIVGYVHSFPSFPSHFVKSRYSPHKIILNSTDQLKVFKNYLNWEKKDLIFLPSTRFSEHTTNLDANSIYLPIDFYSSEKIIKTFKNLIKIKSNLNISTFKIRNHPAALNSKKHNILISKLKEIIDKKKETKINKSKKKLAIFIGSTGAVIEALKHNFDVLHIYENTLFERYHHSLWPSLKYEILDEKIVNYKLIKHSSIQFDNNQNNFKNYLNFNNYEFNEKHF